MGTLRIWNLQYPRGRRFRSGNWGICVVLHYAFEWKPPHTNFHHWLKPQLLPFHRDHCWTNAPFLFLLTCVWLRRPSNTKFPDEAASWLRNRPQSVWWKSDYLPQDHQWDNGVEVSFAPELIYVTTRSALEWLVLLSGTARVVPAIVRLLAAGTITAQTVYMVNFYSNVVSGPTVLFTCNVLAMSILVPLSTVNISTTSNCLCPIVCVAVVFCQF